ncbi:hypothetical protein V6N13_040007 [Hibiscus sabdariffa]
MVCFHCGIYGHHKDLCPRLCSLEATSSAIATSVSMANGLEITVPADPYGPWMLVEHSLSDKNVNSALQESALELFPENHALVDVISTQLDQPILVQQIMPIINGPNTKSTATNSIQRKKTNVINKKVAVTPLGPKKTGSLAVKSSKSQMSLNKLAMHNARNIASSSGPSRAIVSKKINSLVLDPTKNQVVHRKDGEHPPIPYTTIAGELDINDHSGCGSRSFIRSTREYLRDQRADIMAFVEPRISRIQTKADEKSTLLTFVYASPNQTKRKHLWNYLRHLSHHITEPWAFIGDFNATLTMEDRKGCSNSFAPDRDFIATLFDAGLHDLSYQGPDFTWYRDLYCFSLANLFIAELIASFDISLDGFNMLILTDCSIYHRKRSLMAHLRGIQRCLDQRRSAFLTHLESQLLLDLEQTLDQEELLWKQKSQSEWVKFGDRNIAFFHKRAIIHKRALCVTSLQLESGDWCSDEDALHDEAVSFFQKLFTIDTSESTVCPLTGCFPHVPTDEMQQLSCIPEPLEIKEALFSMLPLKSPGPDGLHAQFFQKN